LDIAWRAQRGAGGRNRGQGTAGKLLGDARLTTEGRSEKVEGKIQNAVGGMKDAARDGLKK
jgi:uncharacterized protein YjbJ (UPF0337 family)